MTEMKDYINEMKSQTYGVEVEMNNITRENAAKIAAQFFGTYRFNYIGTVYQTWVAYDAQDREWKFERDSSIAGPDSEKCELVTPILNYNDLETLQELVRKLRNAGARSSASRGCGVHIHVGADGHTPQTLRNLVNMMYSHEDQLSEAINIAESRKNDYCKIVAPEFLEQLNKKKPTTWDKLEDIWYKTNDGDYDRTSHYNFSRYHMLNLHAVFTHGTVEFRLFQFDNPSEDKKGGIHAGQLKAMIQLCLAMNQLAKTLKTVRAKKSTSENTAFTLRTWMIRLGFIGDEFKTARTYFLRNAQGNSAWRHGEATTRRSA